MLTEAEIRQRLEETIEGSRYSNGHPSSTHIECDFCSGLVEYTNGIRVGQYRADDIINDSHPEASSIHAKRPLLPLSTYCADCTTERLHFPCLGIAEARVEFTFDRSLRIREVEITDVSPADDGIPWHPTEVVEAIAAPDSGHLQAMTLAGHRVGPEDVVTFVMASTDGIDIAELVNYDGSLNRDVLERARESYRESIRQLDYGYFSREHFHRHVTGKK